MHRRYYPGVVASALLAGCETLEALRDADDEERIEAIRENAAEEFDDCELIEEGIDLGCPRWPYRQ